MKRITSQAVLLLAVIIHIAAGQAVTPVLGSGTMPSSHKAQPARSAVTRLEVYGFAQMDAIFDAKTNNPEWFDVNRPSELPTVPGEFGRNGHTWFGVRQSRFGTKATIPTSTNDSAAAKDITIVFEWDLFGVGADAGQTTFRPRLVYGQWGDFGAGNVASQFMDADVRPTILDAWGPSGMVDFRNVQIFWQPVHRDNGTKLTFALERPGATGEAGVDTDSGEPQEMVLRFPAPDVTAGYRLGRKFGYAKLGLILRWIGWDHFSGTSGDGGTVMGWGASLSTGINLGKNDLIHLQAVYGAGMENYLKDAPLDVGPKRNPASSANPITVEALPALGIVAFIDHRWTERLASAIGYSRVDVDNSDLQVPTAFKRGQYAVANLIWSSSTNFRVGGELQWAHRDNFRGGFHADDYRFQFAVRYSYSQCLSACASLERR
jgi:hypothetical protein